MTVKDAQPLERRDDTLESLEGATWFSCLEMATRYLQVPVAKQVRPQTTSVTHRGQFQRTCMPFGVTNGPGPLQRVMGLALKGLTWKICLVYLDEHLERLQLVFEGLKAATVKLKRKKCSFLKQNVNFLRNVVSAKGIETDPEKTRVVQE